MSTLLDSLTKKCCLVPPAYATPSTVSTSAATVVRGNEMDAIGLSGRTRAPASVIIYLWINPVIKASQLRDPSVILLHKQLNQLSNEEQQNNQTISLQDTFPFNRDGQTPKTRAMRGPSWRKSESQVTLHCGAQVSRKINEKLTSRLTSYHHHRLE